MLDWTSIYYTIFRIGVQHIKIKLNQCIWGYQTYKFTINKISDLILWCCIDLSSMRSVTQKGDHVSEASIYDLELKRTDLYKVSLCKKWILVPIATVLTVGIIHLFALRIPELELFLWYTRATGDVSDWTELLICSAYLYETLYLL